MRERNLKENLILKNGEYYSEGNLVLENGEYYLKGNLFISGGMSQCFAKATVAAIPQK